MRIFQTFSPMSPEPVQEGQIPMDEFVVYMELDLQWREERIAQLESSTHNEMEKFNLILLAKDRQQTRSRKRKNEECTSCAENFKNSCLNCKEKFSAKKMKINQDEITVHKEEIEKIKNEYKTRLEARQAQIAAEARQKETEANQQAQNGQIKEENQTDYSSSSSSSSSQTSSSNEDVKEEPDVKVEPEEQNLGFIGMQVKSEPMSPTDQQSNASSEGSDSSLSSSDEDMGEEPANEEPANGQQADDQPAFILPQAERFVLEGRYGREFNDGELFRLFLDEF